MRNTAEQAAEQDPSRQILAVAVGLLSLGVLLLAISLAQQLLDFFGVMASHKLHRGTFATSSTFTAEAQQFAK